MTGTVCASRGVLHVCVTLPVLLVLVVELRGGGEVRREAPPLRVEAAAKLASAPPGEDETEIVPQGTRENRQRGNRHRRTLLEKK